MTETTKRLTVVQQRCLDLARAQGGKVSSRDSIKHAYPVDTHTYPC